MPGIAFGAASIPCPGRPVGPSPALHGSFAPLVAAGPAGLPPFTVPTGRAVIQRVGGAREGSARLDGDGAARHEDFDVAPGRPGSPRRTRAPRAAVIEPSCARHGRLTRPTGRGAPMAPSSPPAGSEAGGGAEAGMTLDDLTGGLLPRLLLDLVAMLALVFGLYWRRYRDKELVTAAAMFNVFAFGVLTVLSSVEFSVAAGFGLFAILALFTLRSEPITKIEITYFFGSVAIAVICSVAGTTLPFVAAVAALVVVAAWLLDHPRLLSSVDGVKITLDKIDPGALSNPERMRADLSARLGVTVLSYHITALDYVTDLARITVFYRK